MALLRMNFASKALGMQTNITVCLPSYKPVTPGSDREAFYETGMRFQTLYLLHGGFGDDSDYVSLTSIKRYADDNRVAVVMPCAYNSFYTDSATGPLYWEYVSEELPQVCQTMLPLSARREDNFVGGLSMGGFGAMKMGLMCPDKFAAVLCMSGASINPDKIHDFPRRREPAEPDSPQRRRGLNLDVIFGDKDAFKGGPHDMYHRAAKNVREGKPLPKFFLTVGDQDFALEHVEDAEAYLTSLGYDVFCEVVPGYGHEWPFWDLSLKKALDEWLPLRREVMYGES